MKCVFLIYAFEYNKKKRNNGKLKILNVGPKSCNCHPHCVCVLELKNRQGQTQHSTARTYTLEESVVLGAKPA